MPVRYFAGSIIALEEAAHHRIDRRVLGAVFALAIAVHLPNLWNGFAWDDGYLIAENPAIHSLRNAPDWFIEPWSAGAGVELRRAQNKHFWRPIVQASYAVDWAIAGGAPWLFHVTNDLLHALASALVALLAYLLCVRTGGARAANLAALAAGVLFAVHPVHSEAVNLACYRTTLLASTSVLACLVLHLRGGWHARWAIPLVLALGLLSKESAIVLPGVAFVCDLALGRVRQERWRLARRYAGMLAVVVAYLVLHAVITTSAHFDFLRGASPSEKLFTMLSVLALYVRLLIVPYPLTPFYDWSLVPIRTSLADVEVITGLIIAVALLGILGWGIARRRPLPVLIIGLTLVPLAPYSHLIPFNDVAGERFLYLASAGVCIGVAFGVRHAIVAERRPRLVVAVVAVVAAAYAAFTPVRATHFASSHDLIVATAEMVPESYNAQQSLGHSWLWYGAPDKAIPAFERAHAMYPDLPPAALSLADALERAGRRQDAIDFLRAEQRRLGPDAPPEYDAAIRALRAGGP